MQIDGGANFTEDVVAAGTSVHGHHHQDSQGGRILYPVEMVIGSTSAGRASVSTTLRLQLPNPFVTRSALPSGQSLARDRSDSGPS